MPKAISTWENIYSMLNLKTITFGKQSLKCPSYEAQMIEIISFRHLQTLKLLKLYITVSN